MIQIRRLEPGDDRANFTCGNIDLDRFFRRFAGLNQFRHHIGTTYVAIHAQRFPRYPLPVLRLARLGVHVDRQGQGIGLLLLRAAFVLATQMSKDLGCVGVVVDAKPEAKLFYKKYGFEPLDVVSGHLGDRPQPVVMFLPIASIPNIG